MNRAVAFPLLIGAALLLALPDAGAQVGDTNGSSHYTPDTPNFVAIPHMPTMYINGGGPGAAGAAEVKFLHDWGKYGIEAALDCDLKDAKLAITTLQGYLNSLSAQYDQVSAKGQDGSVILNDTNVVASIINYIRLALTACKPPQGAMLVLPLPPGTEYAAVPERHHDDNPFDHVSIGIGVGIGHDDDHRRHNDRNRQDQRDNPHD